MIISRLPGMVWRCSSYACIYQMYMQLFLRHLKSSECSQSQKSLFYMCVLPEVDVVGSGNAGVVGVTGVGGGLDTAVNDTDAEDDDVTVEDEEDEDTVLEAEDVDVVCPVVLVRV